MVCSPFTAFASVGFGPPPPQAASRRPNPAMEAGRAAVRRRARARRSRNMSMGPVGGGGSRPRSPSQARPRRPVEAGGARSGEGPHPGVGAVDIGPEVGLQGGDGHGDVVGGSEVQAGTGAWEGAVVPDASRRGPAPLRRRPPHGRPALRPRGGRRRGQTGRGPALVLTPLRPARAGDGPSRGPSRQPGASGGQDGPPPHRPRPRPPTTQ